MNPPADLSGLGARQRDWDQLRHLLAVADSSGIKALSESDLADLPGLYRKALSDLSLLRSSEQLPGVQQELGKLCNRAHSLLYSGSLSKPRVNVRNYLLRDVPQAVCRHSRYILATAAVMVLFAVIGWYHASTNREMASSVLSDRMVGGIETSLKAARKQADLGLAAQIPREERLAMALAITANNIGVSIRAFVLGILGGIFSILIIAFNGYMLGVIWQIYFTTAPGINVNLPLYFVAGIAPHGCIELSAISLAGGAGMMLGFSWLFPGAKPRGVALREAATGAGRIMVACAVTLLFAGLIEGCITPMLPPSGIDINTWYWAKIVFGVSVWLLWLAWLSSGRHRSTADTDGKQAA